MADGAVVTTVLDTGAGRDGLVRRLVEVPPGSQYEGVAGPGGELWFVIAGAGRLSPGAGHRVSADGPDGLRLDSVSLPAGAAEGAATAAAGRADAPDDAAGPRLS